MAPSLAAFVFVAIAAASSVAVNVPRALDAHRSCYRRDMLIAEGSQAKVYRAAPCTSDHPVAIKTMDRDDECTRAEVKFMQKFGQSTYYRGVPQLFDLIKTRRHLHVVMQYFQGSPLTDWKISSLQSIQKMDLKLYEDRIMMVFYKVVAVLNMVHNKGWIHLDLKPRNILVDRFGNIMVIDFGGVKMRSTNRRAIERLSGKYMYTKGYQAPELAQGKRAGYASDIYSLGCCGLRLTRRISDRVTELLPRLHRLIRLTTKENPKSRPTAQQLLFHDIFLPERERFFESGDDVSSLQWLEKVVALKGRNMFYFDKFPLPSDNGHDIVRLADETTKISHPVTF